MEYKKPNTLKQAIALLHYQESRGCSQSTLEGTLIKVTNFIKYKEKKKPRRAEAPPVEKVLVEISRSSEQLRTKVTGLSEVISLGVELKSTSFLGYSPTLNSLCEVVYLRDRINELFALAGVNEEGQEKLRRANVLSMDIDTTPAKDKPAQREADLEKWNHDREEFINKNKAK